MKTEERKCFWCYHWFDCDLKDDWWDVLKQAETCERYEREPGADDGKGGEDVYTKTPE